MSPLEKFLQRFFAASQGVQDEWSKRWRAHANRRTIIVSIVAGTIATLAWIYVIQPPDNFPLETLVSVPDGESLTKISQRLQDEGVVRNAFAFRMLVVLLGSERNVKAGDYLFKEPRDIFSVAHAMSLGAYGLEPIRIRIPEGANTKDMATIYSARLERFNAANFLVQAQPQEGYLFPDTYFFLPNATEDTVIKAMRQNFDNRESDFDDLVQKSGHSLSDIVVMASIIEREGRGTSDRKMISGVLWNRIKRGMPLQVDATFFYTLGKGTFQLTMKDLTTPSPYNTYINKGLPPTAIGSPSLDSLMAAADPTPNEYLYFLADKNGVTHFCKTYSCQVANKHRYF